MLTHTLRVPRARLLCTAAFALGAASKVASSPHIAQTVIACLMDHKFMTVRAHIGLV
jgi:hypothetical protein